MRRDDVCRGGQKGKESVVSPHAVPMEQHDVRSVTITDFVGREVIVETPVKKIVFPHYAMAEVLKILDAWDLVVGRNG
jgi:ABC-type Fe3+-hydroxamate transport system substrate-binding protein